MKNRKEIFLYELIWIFIGVLSLVSVGLFTVNYFIPLLSLLGSIVLTALLVFLFKFKIVLKDARFTLPILLILLFGLVLRLEPWIYLEGGQDQGLYVTMSKQFDSSKGLHFEDIAYKYLEPKVYEKYTLERPWYVLGLKRDVDNSMFFDFYPLHSLLMSTTSTVLGDTSRVYSLTFFSILSLIGIYLLTVEISGRKLAGYIATGLMVVSPLHLYFSRFPVADVIALAIGVNFLYFALKLYKEKRPLFLFLSVLLVNMYLYLRLTFVIAIPFVAIATFLGALYTKEKKLWYTWGIFILASFFLSTLFYFIKYNYLYEHFYGKIFDLVPEVLFYIILILSIPIIYLLTSKFSKISKSVTEFLFKHKVLIIYILIGILLLYTGLTFYRLGFTDKYAGTPIDYFWHSSGGGWYSLKDMSLSSIVLHLSPIGILVYLILLKKTDSWQKALLTIFLFSYLAFNIMFVKYTFYQFYYARYQLSEIIPIATILISIFLVELYEKRKRIARFLLYFLFFYNIFFSIFQFQGYVGTTSKTFDDIAKYVTKNDFVIYEDQTSWGQSFVFNPLKYYFGYPSLYTRNADNTKIYLNGLKRDLLNKVYVLSTKEINDRDYDLVNTIVYERGFYASAIEAYMPLAWEINDWQIPYCNNYVPEKFCSGIIPIKYHKGTIDLYLYQVN